MVKHLKKVVAAIAVFTSVFIGFSAYAGLAIRPLIMYYEKGGKPYQDVSITNQDKKKVYLEVTPARLENPGTKQQQRLTNKNPKKLGMLVTPMRVVLAPGQTRNIRVSLLSPIMKKEQIFRIRVEPKENKFVSKGEEGKLSAGLHIIVAYDIKVRVAPRVAQTKLKMVREGQKITYINEGNVTTSFVQGRQCNAKGLCVPVRSTSVFAGQAISMQLKHAWPVTFITYNASGKKITVKSN
jgi:P pilus assembly chaperone PapD